jgi:hypothetical protein
VRLLIAGFVGAILAGLIFVAVLYLADLRVASRPSDHERRHHCDDWYGDCRDSVGHAGGYFGR